MDSCLFSLYFLFFLNSYHLIPLYSQLQSACTAVCPFLPSFCAYKNITCGARRLAEEEQHFRPGEFSAETIFSGENMKNHPLYVNHDDES